MRRATEKINSLPINVHYCTASKHPITLKCRCTSIEMYTIAIYALSIAHRREPVEPTNERNEWARAHATRYEPTKWEPNATRWKNKRDSNTHTHTHTTPRRNEMIQNCNIFQDCCKMKNENIALIPWLDARGISQNWKENRKWFRFPYGRTHNVNE